MNRTLLARLLILFTATVAGSALAKADTLVDITYNVSLNSGISVTDLVSLYKVSNGVDEGTFAYRDTLSPGSSLIIVPKDITPPFEFPESVLMIGLATGVPGDTGPTLAVFGSYSSSQIGESFSTLFPDANESTLITDLGDPDANFGSSSTFGVYSSLLGEAVADGIGTVPGGSFDVVGYTNGQLIGMGTTEVTIVPEPFTLSLFGSGLAGVIAMRRRKAKPWSPSHLRVRSDAFPLHP